MPGSAPRVTVAPSCATAVNPAASDPGMPTSASHGYKRIAGPLALLARRVLSLVG